MVATGLMTAEELANLPEDGRQYELVRGRLITLPRPIVGHGYYCGRIAGPLMRYLDPDLTTGFLNDTGVLLEVNPDTVRGPDIFLVFNEYLPPRPWFTYMKAPLALVVEISPSGDCRALAEEKIADYCRAGVRLIWYFFPETKTVWVDGAGREHVVLTETDALDGSDVLPGLLPISIADIFRS